MTEPQKTSDWQLYRRLVTYVFPYWYLFALSIAGYVLYSLGNVLLADLMQFLLDSLNDSAEAESGLVARAAYALLDEGDMTRLEFARIGVPVAMTLPKSSTTMRSVTPITKLISCSMSNTV